MEEEMNSFISKPLCLLLIYVLPLTSIGLPSAWAAQPVLQTETPSPDQVADRLEKVFAALETAAKEIPRDTFDPEVIIYGQPEAGIEGIGTDPQAIFEWVRDNTYLVPYRGALRDARGVLMDRVGNSFDRAILLFVLLYEAGHKTLQLAHAELSDEQAEILLTEARPIPDEGALSRREASLDEQLQEVARYADEFGLEQDELLQLIEEMNLESKRLREEAVERTIEQSQRIVEMLKEKDLVPSRKEQMTRLRAEAIEALKQHWWVQWCESNCSNGGWFAPRPNIVDLDPSLPYARVGEHFVPAEEIFPGNELTQRLGSEMHTVQIRLIIERWVNGRLVETPVLSQEFYSAAFLGERIAIHHAPMNWPDQLDLFAAEDPVQALKETVLAQREWVPVLTVGDVRVGRLSFTDSGLINDPTLPYFIKNALAGRQLAEGVEGGVRALGDIIRNMLAPVTRNPETNESLQTSTPTGPARLTAEWIEYEIRTPGREPQTIRRQIFDMIGPAARAAALETASEGQPVPGPQFTEEQLLNRNLALLGQTEILLMVSQVSPEYAAYLRMPNLLKNAQLFQKLLRNNTLDREDPTISLPDQNIAVKPFPEYLYRLSLARSEWSRKRGYAFIERLNILSFHRYLRNDIQKEMLLGNAFDIVSNGIGVSPGSKANPFLVRIEQGVLDTNAEALLQVSSGALYNTAELFRRSSFLGSEWSVFQNTDDLDATHFKISADVHARVQNELLNDYVVVAPTSAIDVEGREQYGWWRLDLLTGNVLGMGEYGWGQTVIERVLLFAVVTFYVNLICWMFGSLFEPDIMHSDDNIFARATSIHMSTGQLVCLATAGLSAAGLAFGVYAAVVAALIGGGFAGATYGL